MSKNAEGWIRHNSKQQPVDDHVEVEIRTRGGDYEVCKASGFTWDATAENQIVAYRLHKPAEQVEACSKPELRISLPENYGEIIGGSVEGPLQWRDRIAEIDSTAQALTTERAELVKKLASEGFALIGRVAEPVEDMSDWRNWKAGDSVECLNGNGWGNFVTNGIYRVTSVAGDIVMVEGSKVKAFISDFKFHSRPSA